MISPVETIADALIAFILSLLRDPDAAEDFVAHPQSTMDGHGLGGVCRADLQAVAPVIIDHPSVVQHPNPPSHPHPHDTDVVNDIVRMVQQFTTIDARSTVVDQSVNQNIWTEGGDVTQVFDQDAVVASGDDAIAAGDDATTVDSDVDVTVGDVSVGNETNTGSHNTTGDPDDADAEDTDAAAAAAAGGGTDGDAGAAAGDAVHDAVDAATTAAGAPTADAPDPVAASAPAAPAAPADVPEPADLLESDMTAPSGGDAYDADAASAAIADEPAIEDPLDDD